MYVESKLIRTSNCDFTGHWRPSSILAQMQELAGTHAHLLGCGREPMLEKGIVWVLSRTEVQMARYPAVGETVRMETFPMKNRRWFFPRYFLFYDEAGEVIGKASTLWVLMDIAERKMAAPDTILGLIPNNESLTAPLPFPGNIAVLGGESRSFSYMPTNTDIDVNMHMNNTKYADVLCNALTLQDLAENEIAQMLIHYHKEVRPETELTLQLEKAENRARLSGFHGGEKHFDMGVVLRKRGK